MTPKEEVEKLIDKYLLLFSVTLENTISRYEATHCAIFEVQSTLKENESVLEMLKIHGNDRTRLPVKFRIIFLRSVLMVLENKLK
jgi:hypothetical protein